MLILDPGKNRELNALTVASRFAIPREITLKTTTGSVKALPVMLQAPSITLSRMSAEACQAAPKPEVIKLDEERERVVIGLVLQYVKRPKEFLHGVINLATGEGVFETCPSPMTPEAISGGTALPVSERIPGYAAIPLAP